MSAMLQISGLKKRFGGVNATDNVNLDVKAGELHAVIGPNGAGKTTLIAQLCGSVSPDEGTIRFDRTIITGKPPHKISKLGITRSFQITSLMMNMSVLDNVRLAIQARDGHAFHFFRSVEKIVSLREEAFKALEEVGLQDRTVQPVAELSHGEHRQLEIAIALASGAKLMLLDEPMAGLGPTESANMITLLKSLKGKRTILLIEHDMDAVFALADRISVLVYGRIIATGTPEEIRSNDAVRHAYLGED